LIRTHADPLVGLPGTNIYSAAGETRPTWQIEHLKLRVKGFVLDLVSTSLPKAIGGYIPSEWFQLVGWTDWSIDPPDQFWRTLVANRALDTLQNPSRLYPMAFRSIMHGRVMGLDLDTKGALLETNFVHVKEFIKRLQQAIWGRQLIRTSSGFLGLAPSLTQVGDTICIFHGCNVPVVLRLVGEHYKFLGQCYINNMMDGEALDLQKSKSISMQEFVMI
jgi:hypothetical protein